MKRFWPKQEINITIYIQEAQQSQTEAVNKLSALQTEQNNLVNNLGEINSLLTRQLELISNINTDEQMMRNIVSY